MNFFKKFYRRIIKNSVWARPKMPITFRAEVMTGRSREERTFLIEHVLPNGRVTLKGFSGEHRESAFEPVNFEREKS
jgi:hypothetical protein